MIEGVSRRTLAGSSGTYNVRATELAIDRGRIKSINATVVFLDDTQHCFKIDVSEMLIYLFIIFIKLVFNEIKYLETCQRPRIIRSSISTFRINRKRIFWFTIY